MQWGVMEVQISESVTLRYQGLNPFSETPTIFAGEEKVSIDFT